MFGDIPGEDMRDKPVYAAVVRGGELGYGLLDYRI